MNIPLEFVTHLMIGYSVRTSSHDYEPVLRVMRQYLTAPFYQNLMIIYQNNDLELVKDLYVWFEEPRREENMNYRLFYERTVITTYYK